MSSAGRMRFGSSLLNLVMPSIADSLYSQLPALSHIAASFTGLRSVEMLATWASCALLYTPLSLVGDCDQLTTMTSPSHAHAVLGLAAAVSACADQQFLDQTPTGSAHTCETANALYALVRNEHLEKKNIK